MHLGFPFLPLLDRGSRTKWGGGNVEDGATMTFMFEWIHMHSFPSLSSLFCLTFLTNELSLAFQKDGFVFSFWHFKKIPTVCKHAQMVTCTRAYTREVRSLARTNVVVGEKKSGNSGQHSKTYKRFNNMTFWTFSSTWWFVLNLENFKFVGFLQIWKKMETIGEKKCYIALWIIRVLWTFNLLDSISISNNSTRLLSNNKKKRNVQKQNGLSWNLLYQQGKNSCVIISIIRCLRNYFNHTMFKMTRKLCYKPVCNCDAHHTRLVEHSKIFMPCVGKTPSAKLVHSVCEDS